MFTSIADGPDFGIMDFQSRLGWPRKQVPRGRINRTSTNIVLLYAELAYAAKQCGLKIGGQGRSSLTDLPHGLKQPEALDFLLRISQLPSDKCT